MNSATTLTGREVPPLSRSLPRTVRSLCPECLRLIPAEECAEGGRVVMRKTCPAHGAFEDIVFSDAAMFLRLEDWHFGDGHGFANPAGGVDGFAEGFRAFAVAHPVSDGETPIMIAAHAGF